MTATEPEMITGQYESGTFFLKKNEIVMRLVHEWNTISIENNYRYSDEPPSILRDHPGFAEHRHDQSISSLLIKRFGYNDTKNMFHPHMNNNRPINIARNKNGTCLEDPKEHNMSSDFIFAILLILFDAFSVVLFLGSIAKKNCIKKMLDF